MPKLIDDVKKRSEEQRIHTLRVIREMIDDCQDINYYTVAERAGVSRPFLYRYAEISTLIDACRTTGLSKRDLQQEVVRLRFQIREMEAKGMFKQHDD